MAEPPDDLAMIRCPARNIEQECRNEGTQETKSAPLPFRHSFIPAFLFRLRFGRIRSRGKGAWKARIAAGRGAAVKGESMVKRLMFVWALGVLVCAASAQQKPTFEIAKDGFPTGQATPEGAACDYARAFINLDKKALRAVVMPPHGSARRMKRYEEVLDNISASLDQQAAGGDRRPTGRKAIIVCFAARSLTDDGPASYAYAHLSYGDVKFVDVKVQRVNGTMHRYRTLTLRQPDGKWVVDPVPTLDPKLSAGLKDETRSTKDFLGKNVARRKTKKT
jgi:hypothetical protein